MNLTRLKTYAPAARNALITAVTRRAGNLGIQPGRVEEVTESGNVALIGGQPFPRSIVPLRKQLLDLIQREGFDQTMEAMAYTWFNRLVALRFMELHDGYLDHGYRVLSHPQGTPLPEILQHAEHVSLKGLDREEVIRLKLDGNRDEELYRLLLLAQCAELNHILPDVFGKLDDATILLLPDNLLHSDSVIRQLVADSDAEDWQQVEILGWLYQFYISEKKDAVMARKSAVPTEDIPAVTQLFTPHWIVRYLVENSLGRLWLLNRPSSRLREHMPYYIEGETETEFLKITKPEDIRLCDPAVGSGHMLTYAFDLLALIYEEEGYAPTEIPGLILRHNLYGLEICPRAAQLAELALVFKAREKSRRFFQPEHLVRPRIIELRDVRFAENELRDYIHALGLGDLFNQPMLRLLHQFEEAKNFGSLIQPCLDERAIADVRRAIEAKDLGGQLFLRETHLKVLRVLEQAEALTQRYHVVVANPPYMGGENMNVPLKDFFDREFPNSKANLYAGFIERNASLVQAHGLCAMITMHNWMFLTSFSKFRTWFLHKATLCNLLHLGARSFDSISGEVVQTAAFVFIGGVSSKAKAIFFRLTDGMNEKEKEADYLSRLSSKNFSAISSADFDAIPGSPVAYWLNQNVFQLFRNGKSLGDVSDAREGLSTGNNEKHVRFWPEVEFTSCRFEATDRAAAKSSGCRWFPYNKGGTLRRWYGNADFLVNWKNDGHELQTTLHPSGERIWAHNFNLEYIFKPSVSWSDITTKGLAGRFYPKGFVFDATGLSAFYDNEETQFVGLGLLNSKFANSIADVLNPTLHFKTGDYRRLPLPSKYEAKSIATGVVEAIAIARADWDNFETSWDFRDQPLLRPGLKGATLEASWRNWEAQSTAAIRRMQELETENNRLFIAAYGLDGELQPEVPEAQITLARAEARRDMAAFLSYAVGCMMGRYSLDAGGLILANAGDTVEDYVERIAALRNSTFSIQNSTFHPDTDAIIPVLDGEWFEDDIVTRTKEFLRATFGEATLSANIAFIEAALGKDLRTYFLNDFYKDHLQTYKSRPIYWLFTSGKQKAFQCLVYLHRYTPGTLARIRTEYAIPLQGKLSGRITRLEEGVANASSSAARKKLQTELDQCKKQIVELLAFDEQLRSHADQRITLDLDDGVKANYAKFGPLLAEAKKVCGTKDD
jgi:hypothetical protein